MSKKSPKGGGYLRVKERTLRAIKVVAAEFQAQSAEDISADDAVWKMIQVQFPHIAQRFEEETPSGDKPDDLRKN